ncbi:MAG: ribonuclease Z [Flavobacteriales bacterium]|nr:ribonuclease Z [Flavobacteriales bacterium]
MTFEVNILGCGAATPTLKRNPTSQLLNVHDKYYLIDCGEGTQLQLRRFKFKFQRINHIFISHLHGDHYLGLLGLISSMHLLGRTKELHLYCPPELKDIVEVNMKHSETFLNFEVVYHPIDYKVPQLILEDNTMEVHSFPLKHRIKCAGFLFVEKPKRRRIIKEKIEEYNLVVPEIVRLKKGQNIERLDGKVITFEDATLPPYPVRSYAYCSDTAYYEKVLETIQGVDLLYHEATFLEEHAKRAKETFHSTAIQAATIAQKAEAKKLVLGHFSSRYRELNQFTAEAKTIFPKVELARDGMSIIL